MHRLLLGVSVLALAFGATLQGSRQEPRRPGPLETAARQVETRLDRSEARTTALEQALLTTERRLARLEALHGPQPPQPPPTRPPTRPPTTEPPDTGPLRASWHFELEGGSTAVGGALASEGLLEAQAGPLRLTVVWEDLDGQPGPDAGRWTAVLANSQAGRGVVRWESLELRVEGQPVLTEARGVMVPRGALARTSLTLEDLRLIPERWDAPVALRARALDQVEAARAEWVGPYRFLLPAADGGTDAAAPGGRATAPWHGGRRDWATAFAEGRWYRLHELLDPIHRPLHLDEPDGSPWLPGPHGVRYWWDAAAVGYAREWAEANKVPGWGWSGASSGWVPYEDEIVRRPISDFSHAGRWYKAAAAQADVLRIARWYLVHVCWAEHQRSYSMDERVPGSPTAGLYNPLWYFVEPGGLSKNLDRREAHAIEILTEAAPYLDAETVRLYAAGWDAAIAETRDRFGIVDHSRTGDAASAGLPGNVTMWFQNCMVIVALRRMAELPGVEHAGPTADALTRWWLPTPEATPPYYATTSSGKRSATAAPNKGHGTPQYVWSVDGMLRAPIVDEVVQNTIGQGWGEPDLDYYPAELRGW